MHVQGPGGNTSIKVDDHTMFIKASGFELQNATNQDMFVKVDFRKVRQALEHRAENPLLESYAEGGLRPSIETTLHALLPHRVVLHTHTVQAIAVACGSDAQNAVAASLDGFVQHVFVPYARPGTPLALALAHALKMHPDASVVILGNHGVVVGADTTAAAVALLEQVTRRLNRRAASVTRSPDLAGLRELAAEHNLELPEDARAHDLGLRPEALEIALGGTLYPDHAVFLGPAVGLLAQRAVEQELASTTQPKLWLVPGMGVLVDPALSDAAHAMVACLASVVSLLPDRESCRYLSAGEVAELLGMEEEKYRQQLARQTRH
jgi:rhamnose utilization protein RhaD (predicted bifunctional aldolase and dehydrogenase)